MPSKVDLTNLQGNMRSLDSASIPSQKDYSTKPPQLPPLMNKSRRSVSTEGFTSSHTLVNPKESRRSSLGNGKSHKKKSTGPSRSQTTQGTQSSSCTSSSTDDKQMEVDNPILKLFDIRSRLGKGAYGIVWEAYDRRSGAKVALKKIFDAFRNGTDSQRTYREIVFLREFGHHPHMINLVSVHRATNEQDIYLVFPYMDHDLHKLVKSKPELLTDDVIKSIIYQVLVALKYLHSAEVIHRDLKPANILMNARLQVKVADFGLARSLTNDPDDSVANHEIFNSVMTDYVATRWYRPPEILLSCKTYTKGVDMWSIGCILGEMLLKKPLFAGNSTIDQIQTILKTIETPREEDIEELCQGSGNKIMNPSVIRAGLEEQGDTIDDIFHESDLETVDFLERLLVFNPTKRINVAEALLHPYVSCVREPKKEWICERLVRPPLSDDVRLNVDDYRSTIYDMIEMDEESARIDQGQKFTGAGDQLLNKISEDSYEETNNTEDAKSHHHYHPHDEIIEEEYCHEFDDEFKEFKEQRDKCQGEEEDFVISEEVGDGDNEELDISTPINEPPAFFNNNNDSNNNNDFNSPTWANYGSPPVVTKSVSDPTANATTSNNASYSSPDSYKLTNATTTSVVDRPSKNVSILTLPSEIPKPYTVPMIIPSQLQNVQIIHTTPNIEDNLERVDFSGGDKIIEKFQNLCQKYDVMEEFEKLGSHRNKDKTNSNKAKKAQSCGDYEFLSRVDNNNEKTNHSRKTSPNPWTGVNNNPSSKSQSQYHWGQPKLPQINSDGADGDNNIKGMSYDGDIRRIQDSLTKEASNGTGFVNPYKPKGLKTSAEKGYGMGDLFEDFEIRNSRSLPSQLGRQQHQGSADMLKNDCGFQFIKTPLGYEAEISKFQHQSQQQQGYRYQNGNQNQGIKTSQSRLEGSAGPGSSKSFHRRQDNPQSHNNQANRLAELFPNKEAIQSRIQEMERRVKAKGVVSKESLNSTDGLILINGKNNTSNKNQQRQKQFADVPKKKFTFNRPGKKEEAQPPVRPYGGRHYDKKFHGPSFRRSNFQSFSDSDGSALKSSTADLGNQFNLRPTTDAEMARKPTTHSAYFPNSGVTHPLSSLKSNSRDKLTSKTVKTSSGFAAVHPVPSSSSYNSRPSQGHHNQSRAQDYRYPPKTPLQPQYASTIRYDPFETPAASVSIRASDLFELRNNVARERRLGNHHNRH